MGCFTEYPHPKTGAQQTNIYADEMLGKSKPVRDTRTFQPEVLADYKIDEFVLEAGDILYMPRGIVHQAETLREGIYLK